MDSIDAARYMYARDRTADAFGIDLVEASAHRAIVAMTVRDDMCNGLDVMHGGMTFLLADSAMAFASNFENEAAFATSAEIDWLAPARAGQRLTATATRRHGGGRSALWDVVVTDDDGSPVALFRGRTRKVGQPVIRD